jgi:hypothetical protein
MNRNVWPFGWPAVLLAAYVAAFVGYHWWADSTSDSRPHGVPAWYFIYPTQTVAERFIYCFFYPCIRLDQIVRDAR